MSVEWRHVTARFHGFIANLQPPPEHRRAAHKAAADVARSLRWRFGPGGGFAPARGSGPGDYLVIGGYGKGTAIRPGRTVDMLYVLPAALRFRGRPGNRAASATLFEDLAASLSTRFSAVDVVGEGWIALLSTGEAGNATAVRLIPCFPCAEGGFLTAGAGAAWHHTNPLAEMARLRRADRISANKATHLIIMLKAWRRARGVPIGALALELLVCEFVGLWTYQRRSLLFYDWMVRDFFFWLSQQGRRTLPVPGVAETVDIGDGWLQEAATAYQMARRACRLERDNRDRDARDRWRDIFGPAFGHEGGALPAGTLPWLKPPVPLEPTAPS